jgi:hypothetical protein
MRQIVTLLILAAMAVGGWLAWPTIKAKFLASQETTPGGSGGTSPPVTTPNSTGSTSTPEGPAKTSDVTLPTPMPMPPLPEAKTAIPAAPEKTAAPTPPLNGKSFHAELTADIVSQGPVAAVEGTTTLPVGTLLEMQVSLDSRLADGQPERLPAEVTSVNKGSPRNVFRWTPNARAGAKSFRLTISVNPEAQTPNVQQLLGPRGELLEGPLVAVRADGRKRLHAVSAPFKAGTGATKSRIKLVLKTPEDER